MIYNITEWMLFLPDVLKSPFLNTEPQVERKCDFTFCKFGLFTDSHCVTRKMLYLIQKVVYYYLLHVDLVS